MSDETIKDLTPAQKTKEREKVAASRRSDVRKKKSDLGALPGQTLAAPPREGYYRRWVNDDGMRLDSAEDKGYSHVTRGRDADKSIMSSGSGDNISQVVGTKENGQPLVAYLMETTEKFRNEDSQEKEDAISATEEQISAASIVEKDSLGSGSGSTTYDPLSRRK